MLKVSVIMPTYKRADMLERAINSVLNQTYNEVEIIVIEYNNQNTDYRKETSKVMKKYKNYNRVRYIKHERNMNGAVARNTGIFYSTGELITFLDDDDWYDEKKIELQVDFLLKHKNYKAVYCGSYRNKEVYNPGLKGDLSFEILSGQITIRTNTIMMWKNIILEIGGWNEEFKRNQEAALLLKFFDMNYKIGVITEPLVYYDLSDRSNALDPKSNKNQFEFHLSYHDKIIDKLERERKNARKIIYTKRYREILFAYLKRREFKEAFKHYIETVIKFPIYFNMEIVRYIIVRLFNRRH